MLGVSLRARWDATLVISLKVCMMTIIFIDDYKLVHYRVVMKHTNIKPLVTYTDTEISNYNSRHNKVTYKKYIVDSHYYYYCHPSD